MYLSDQDIKKAVEDGSLIVDPPPEKYDPTSIDLHLGNIKEAKIWDIDKYIENERIRGSTRPELRIGKYDLSAFSGQYLRTPPDFDEDSHNKVQKRVAQIIVRTGGFLLWQTREKVGTPPENPKYICFVDGKSTRARAGILVHLTAPTIHSGWKGEITLEIVNLGPFDLVLQEGDVIAQLTVATISSPPIKTMASSSGTYDQTGVNGLSD